MTMPELSRFLPSKRGARAAATAFLMSLASVTVGCESGKADEGMDLTFPDKDGYFRFVNRDTLPNNFFNVRSVASVTVRAGIFKVSTAKGETFLVPQHRVIYAGKEFK